MFYPSRRQFLQRSAALAALPLLRPTSALACEGKPHGPWQPPRFSRLGTFKAQGDLARRQTLNFNRLEESKYQPDHVFQGEVEAGNWPGDTEGRTILALVLLAQATGRTPKFLNEIIGLWPTKTNELGFFGHIQPEGQVSEQQISGHGWALRALAEFHRWQPEGPARSLAEPILSKLFLPTAGLHRDYPLEPESRRAEGSYSGTHLGRVGNWLLSTDVGCDFIGLDGLVDACEAFGDERLRPLIAEMVARFLEMDIVKLKAQTHASLTACRALLRWSDLCGDTSLVDRVRERFDLYTNLAWTEHHANHNWFGRPEWTEPCAIIDSLMVATELWRRTGQTTYLERAHLIYFNALGHGQRSNGGFGCDNCPGHGEDDVYFKVYEAHWCCTMRGGEGLSRLSQYSVARSGDNYLLPFGLPGHFQDGEARIDIASAYPFEPRFSIQASGLGKDSNLKLFIPPWLREVRAQSADGTEASPHGAWLRLPCSEGKDTWTITGEFAAGTRELLPSSLPGQDKVARFRGPLLLGGEGEDTRPLFNAYETGVEDPEASRRRLLVPRSAAE